MKINVEELKTLVEAGDESAIQAHIIASLEKGDVSAAAKANSDVLSELDSLKDTHHQTALNTFKEKQLPKLIKDAEDAKEEAVRKELAPEETPIEKEVRELRETLQKEKIKTARAELRSKLLEVASGEEVGLDSAFINKHIDKFIPSNIEIGEDGEINVTTILDGVKPEITALAEDIKTVVQAKVETTLKGAARDDVGGGIGGQQQKQLLGEKLAKQSQHAQAKEQQSQFFG